LKSRAFFWRFFVDMKAFLVSHARSLGHGWYPWNEKTIENGTFTSFLFLFYDFYVAGGPSRALTPPHFIFPFFFVPFLSWDLISPLPYSLFHLVIPISIVILERLHVEHILAHHPLFKALAFAPELEANLAISTLADFSRPSLMNSPLNVKKLTEIDEVFQRFRRQEHYSHAFLIGTPTPLSPLSFPPSTSLKTSPFHLF
jgi:hypothetical protein